MAQGTFSNTLIGLEAFKRIFVFRPKIDFFPRCKSRVFRPKQGNFLVGIFHSFISLGILACRKTPLGA